jgi:hypothetical protein
MIRVCRDVYNPTGEKFGNRTQFLGLLVLNVINGAVKSISLKPFFFFFLSCENDILFYKTIMILFVGFNGTRPKYQKIIGKEGNENFVFIYSEKKVERNA